MLSDVDGTQIKPNVGGFPSEAVKAAARKLHENNIYLLEATSRPHALMQKLVLPLDLRRNLCTLDGGATVAHADNGEVVWSQWLSAEAKRSIITTIGGLCTKINFDSASRRLTSQEVLANLEADDSEEGTPAIFAVFDGNRSDEIVEALTDLTDIKHTDVMPYDKNPDWRCMQVVDAGIDKQHGVEQAFRHAHLLDKRSLAIGDGPNDESLFAAVGKNGIKVAMGNAGERLKDLADWVAPPVEEDGFAVAMEHYELLPP